MELLLIGYTMFSVFIIGLFAESNGFNASFIEQWMLYAWAALMTFFMIAGLIDLMIAT